jgi:integrase
MRGEASAPPLAFSGAPGIDPLTLRPVPRGGGLRFRTAAELAIAAAQRDEGAALRPSTIAIARTIHRQFIGYSGDCALADVSRAMVSGFLAKIGADRGLSNLTLRQYVAKLSAIWKWARSAGYVEGDNPFAQHTFRVARGNGYQPYAPEELAKLFASPPETLGTVMRVLLYSGLRLNEAASLRCADIRQEQGVWVFDVREGDGKRLKTPAAARLVPLHGRLVDLTAREGDWLFPGLASCGPDGKRSLSISQAFTTHRRACGLDWPGLCAHSLRKNFASALDRAGVPLADAAALLGHSRGFSWDVYSSGPGLVRLSGLVGLVEYEGLHPNN